MPTVQQTIAVRQPANTVYNQLTQFRDYPQFMQDVDDVEQIDDTHLHWRGKMAERNVEWDSTILEQVPDRCIAWQNMSGPVASGRIDVEPAEADSTRVTLTLELDAAQLSPSGGTEETLSRQAGGDLQRFKQFLETRGSETGAWRGEIHDAKVSMRDRDAKSQQSEPSSQARPPSASYAAGSEGWDGTESDPSAPVISSPVSPSHMTGNESQSATQGEAQQDGRFEIAEEVNTDQQSNTARRIGQPPEAGSSGTGANPLQGLAESMQQDQDAQSGASEKKKPE